MSSQIGRLRRGVSPTAARLAERPLTPSPRAALVLLATLLLLTAVPVAVARPATAPAATARAATARVRIGAPPALPAGTAPLAASLPTGPIRITIALTPRDPSALAAYAAAVSAPSSASYHHFLRPAGFRRRFAPSAARVAAVDAWLRTRGLRPGRLSANGLAIGVTARVGAVERAFATTLAEVRLPRLGGAIVNTSAPAVGANIASTVQAVIGLSSLNHATSDRTAQAQAQGAVAGSDVAGARATAARLGAAAAHVNTGGPTPCSTAVRDAAPQSAYTADQVASAYGLAGVYASGDEGAGVTIDVYELEPDDPSDIAAYQACYGTNVSITYVPVDGGVRSGPGTGEAALDIEQLIGLVPKAKLIVYQAPNSNNNGPGAGPYDELAAVIGQDLAPVVTDSWGQCEPAEGRGDAAAENTLFEEAAVQGQTFVASSGDSGSEDCDNGHGQRGNTALDVDDPASQPFVTGVGGTSMSALGPPPTETVWNSANGAASVAGQPGSGGGGLSHFWPMPSYQSGAASALGVIGSLSSGTPCRATPTFCREVPDVSASADPNFGYLIYYNGDGASSAAPSGWQGTGGTSAAAPVWAAITALADASPACHRAPVGFLNPILYGLAGSAQATYFHIITSGDNDLTGTWQGLYPATQAYSMAAGLGSPNAATLVPALCAAGLRLAGPASEISFVRQPARIRLRVGVPAGGAVIYRVHGLPPGVSLDQAAAQVTGTVRRLGRYEVTIEAIDNAGNVRRLRFRWIVAARPRLTAAAAQGTAGVAPTLSLSVRAGRDEPALRVLSLRLPPGVRLAGSLALNVLNAGGRSLAHRFTVRRGMLTVRLAAPSRRVELQVAVRSLPRGSGVGRRIPHGSAGSLLATVRTVDIDGGAVTGKVTIRTASSTSAA